MAHRGGADARRGGEKVLVFLRHTGTPELPRRLLRLLREVTPRVAWLDAGRVPTHRREAWIDEHVLARDVEVLLVNPNTVRTGLNNLVAFSVGVWYELDASATTYRQANGRLHRIGQTRPVTILTPYYPAPPRRRCWSWSPRRSPPLSRWTASTSRPPSRPPRSPSDDETASVATAMSLGQAVYERLVGRG